LAGVSDLPGDSAVGASAGDDGGCGAGAGEGGVAGEAAVAFARLGEDAVGDELAEQGFVAASGALPFAAGDGAFEDVELAVDFATPGGQAVAGHFEHEFGRLGGSGRRFRFRGRPRLRAEEVVAEDREDRSDLFEEEVHVRAVGLGQAGVAAVVAVDQVAAVDLAGDGQ